MMTVLMVSLWIFTPVAYNALRTRAVEVVATEIFQGCGDVFCVYISIAGKVTRALIIIGAGEIEPASPKMIE